MEPQSIATACKTKMGLRQRVEMPISVKCHGFESIALRETPGPTSPVFREIRTAENSPSARAPRETARAPRETTRTAMASRRKGSAVFEPAREAEYSRDGDVFSSDELKPRRFARYHCSVGLSVDNFPAVSPLVTRKAYSSRNCGVDTASAVAFSPDLVNPRQGP
jgi:hypothetical protein